MKICQLQFLQIRVVYTPSCKKVVIEGKKISSLVRKEYD